MTAPADPTRKPPSAPEREPERTTATRAGEREPRLPHERDQSSDQQGAAAEQPTEVGRQAARDQRRGLTDTDRGPVIERINAEHFSPAPDTRRRRT
jgi:hypothetical protein